MNWNGILTLLLWELFIPTAVGTIFISVWRPVVGSLPGRLVASWISGQILLFAEYQVLAVPFILKGKSIPDLVPYQKKATLALLSLAVFFFLVRTIIRAVRKKPAPDVAPEVKTGGRPGFWILFWMILAVQLVMGVVMTYADGDDAYYMAVATLGTTHLNPYSVDAYTGVLSGINMRYSLAPFPTWISFLSLQSGIPTVTVGHIALELEMILLAYGVYWLLGSLLLKEHREYLPLFLVGAELLVLFGDVSTMVPENFLLARSRQGKAALATLVIPMILVMLYLLMEKLQKKGRFGILSWILLGSVVMTGCLCSTLGAALCCLLIGCAGICGAVMMKKIWHLPLLVLICMPCLVYSYLYVTLG